VRRAALWRDQREQALRAALAELDGEEREALTTAIPALRRVLEAMERETW
jgi:sugar (pentulose or hexulose) kinase